MEKDVTEWVERREEKREDKPEPGVELKAPGVGVENGR